MAYTRNNAPTDTLKVVEVPHLTTSVVLPEGSEPRRRRMLPLAIAAAFLLVGVVLIACAYFRAPDPGITITPSVQNLGTLRPSTPNCSFQVTNNFSTSQELDVITSCGCTKAALGSALLKPYESTTLKCSLNLVSRRGPFAISVTVLYRPVKAPLYKTRPCFVEGTVDPIVQLSPDELHFKDGVSERKYIKVTVSERKVHVTQSYSDSKAFVTKYLPDKKLLEISFNSGEWKDGGAEAVATLETDLAPEKRITIPLIVEPSLKSAVSALH